MAKTPTQRLGDVLLGGDDALEHFVRSRRDAEPQMTWRHIARDLWEQHKFDVTHEALRQWYPDEPAEEAS